MPNNHKAVHASFINHLNDNHLAIQSIWQYFRGPSFMKQAKENSKEVSILFWKIFCFYLTFKRIHSGTGTAESVISFVLSAPEDQRLSCTLAHKSESWKVCHLIHFSSKSFLLYNYKLKRGFWIFFACRLMVPFLHIQIDFLFCPSLGSKIHSSEGPTFKPMYKYW